MKILILHPNLAWEGGGDRQVLELALNLEEKGHKVVIFTTEYDRASCFPAISGKLDIRVIGTPKCKKNEVFEIKETRRIAKMVHNIISENNEFFDLINCHTNPMHWTAVHLKKMTHLPIVWMCNDLPPWFLPFFENRVILKEGRRRFLMTLCKWLMYKTLLPWHDRFLSKRIDQVIVLDKRNQRMIERAYKKNACVIRSGLDINKFCQGNREEIRRQYGIQSNVILLLCVGLLGLNRRHEDSIVALRLLTSKGYNVKLMVVGGDNLAPGYAQILHQCVRENNMVDKVLLVGSVPEKRLPDYFAASDIFIYPHINQTWGLAPLEAMAAKRPVIVSMDAGVSEVLVDYETALLIPPKDPWALSSKIAELIDNRDLRERLVKGAYDFVLSNISWDKYCNEMLEVFKSVHRKHYSIKGLCSLIRNIKVKSVAFKRYLYNSLYRIKRDLIILAASIVNWVYRLIFCGQKNRLCQDAYKDIRRILIIQLLKLGDMIVTTPSIEEIRERFPSAYICMMVIPMVESVVSGNPFIDEILIYERKNRFGYIRFIKELRSKKFDLVLDFHNTFFSLRTMLIPFLTGAKYRIGFRRKGFQGFLNTEEVFWSPTLKHEVENYLDLIRVLGIQPKNKELRIYYSQEDDKRIREFLEQRGISDNDLLVCIHPVSQNVGRLWFPDRFAIVADELIAKYKAKVIFTGTSDEKELADEILNLMEKKADNLAGEINLKSFFALIARCNLLITIDTSPVHIASATRTPTVALYGPTNAIVWAPWNRDNQIMIRRNLSCSPCETGFDKKFKCTKGKYLCMREIVPEEVLKAAEMLLKRVTNK